MFQEIYYFEIDEILWIVSIALLFSLFIIFLLKTRKLESKSQKRVYLGYGLFSLLYGFTRVFFILADLCGNAFEGCQYYYLILGYLSGTFGMIIIIIIMETYLLKSKKIFTGITIVLFCIILATFLLFPTEEGRSLALTMTYILLPIVVLTISVSYLYLAIKSSGSSRKKAIGALVSIVLIIVGHVLNTTFYNSVFPDTPLIIGPIIMIGGIILFVTSQLLII
jgi:hypothetical protein